MSNKKDTEISSRYEDLSVEELQKALDAIYDSTNVFSDSDAEKLAKILEALDKKDPLPHKFSVEESWQQFRANYSEEFSRLGVRKAEEVMHGNSTADTDSVQRVSQKEPIRPVWHRRILRGGLIAAAVVVLILAAAVTASAMGCNLFGWIPRWNSGTNEFVAKDTTSQDIPSILKKAGIDVPLYPTWLPEGFLLEEQHIRLDEPLTINSVYLLNDSWLILSIKEVGDMPQPGWIEVDDGQPAEYVKHGTTHYLFSNYDTVISTWYVDKYLVRFSGNVSFEEMEQIIDSIY